MTKARKLADLGNVYDDGALSNRNLIYNGAMLVNQRGTRTAQGGGYMLDRFQIAESGDFLGTTSQATDAPAGFNKSLKIETTNAFTEGSFNSGYVLFRQSFEVQDTRHLNWGTSDAKKVTLSFWVKSSKTGTYAVELNARFATTEKNTILYTVNAANTWEYKTFTFNGYDTSDSWQNADNETGLQIYWWLAAGANWKSGSVTENSWHDSASSNRVTGQVNWADTVGSTFYITGVQLEVGDTATPFEHRSYGDELQRCKRYYEGGTYALRNDNNGAGRWWFTDGAEDGARAYPSDRMFSVEKRATPTLSIDSGQDGSADNLSGYSSGTNYAISSISGTSRHDLCYYIAMSGTWSSSTIPNQYLVGYIEVDAEL